HNSKLRRQCRTRNNHARGARPGSINCAAAFVASDVASAGVRRNVEAMNQTDERFDPWVFDPHSPKPLGTKGTSSCSSALQSSPLPQRSLSAWRHSPSPMLKLAAAATVVVTAAA